MARFAFKTKNCSIELGSRPWGWMHERKATTWRAQLGPVSIRLTCLPYSGSAAQRVLDAAKELGRSIEATQQLALGANCEGCQS
jgi:hypothetical protein